MITRRSVQAVVLAAGLVLAVTTSAGADETAEARIEVGAEAPDFALEAVADGAEHTLSEHRGERPVVMVFFRGAW